MPPPSSSSKIYPAAADHRRTPHNDDDQPPPGPLPTAFTVWKRSSISFHGTDGFTVFDHLGRLIFRVDNYRRKRTARLSSSVVVGSGGGGCRAQVHAKEHGGGGGLVLMDGFGKALLTLVPQLHMPSMHYQWIGYRGEDDQCKPRTPLFMMRRPSQPSPFLLSLRSLSTKIRCEAEVFVGDCHRGAIKSSRKPDYRIEGSFKRRDCKITGADGRTVASISRKLARTTNSANTSTSVLLSDDVFSLVVEAGMEPALVMAFIMAIDRLCPKPHTPFLCS